MAFIVLVRHGQSEWNLQNRFTGWVDVGLTNTGVNEAIKSGELIAKEGIVFDRAFTSLQRRAMGVISKKQDLNTAMIKSISGEEVLIYRLQKLTNKISIIQFMT